MADTMTTLTEKELQAILKGEKEGYVRSCTDGNNSKCIVLQDVIVDDDVSITTDLALPLHIKGGSFGRLTFKGSQMKDLVIEGGTFREIRLIDAFMIESTLTVSGGVFAEDFLIQRCVINGVNLSGGDFKRSIVSDTSSFISFKVNTFTCAQGLYLEGGFYKLLSIAGDNGKTMIGNRSHGGRGYISIGTFNVSLPLASKNNIIVGGDNQYMKINSVVVGDVGKESVLRIYAPRIRNIFFQSSYVVGQVVFGGLRNSNKDFEPVFSVVNSDIGKTQFIDCDFINYKMAIRNSKITEIFLAGTVMPATKNINYYDNDPRQLQFVLSQLKKTFEFRGDAIEAGRYYSDELNTHYDGLVWGRNSWEKFVLFLNKVSSNHGQSWKKGLISTLICAFSFYLVYCTLLGFSVKAIIYHFDKFLFLFLEFVNPLHKSDFIPAKLNIPEIKIPFVALAWENVSRIFISFFLYQLIQAFRKYGKR